MTAEALARPRNSHKGLLEKDFFVAFFGQICLDLRCADGRGVIALTWAALSCVLHSLPIHSLPHLL